MTERKWGVLYGGPAPIIAFTLALALAWLNAFCSYAQSTPVVARAAGVTGQAVLLTPGLAPLALTAGYILNPGDRIDTRGGGRVVIDLSDGSMVVVSPESVVTLKDYRAAASLRELFGITLGMVRVKINHFAGKPNPYRMNSPTASIAVRGTEFSIEVDADGNTQVVVFEGAVEVASLADPDRRVLIEAGRGVLVQGGQDFHLIGANPAPPGNRDAADHNGQQAADKPFQQANAPRVADGHSDGPPPGLETPAAPQGSGPLASAPREQEGHSDSTPSVSTAPAAAQGSGPLASTPHVADGHSDGPPPSVPTAPAAPQGPAPIASAPRVAEGHSDGPPPSGPAPIASAPRVAEGHSDGPPPSGPGTPAAPQGPGPLASGGTPSHGDSPREDTPRASAGTYDRYLAGLVDIAQVPFLLRFNAFAEAHLDSLENPAYATEFRSAEGRVFILPTFRGTRTLQEYQSAFGPGGSLPGDYSISPQISFFAPAGGFNIGGSASVSQVGNTISAQTSGSSSDTYFSAALVAARRFGANSFGVELATLKGTGSISSVTSVTTVTGEAGGPGRLSEEQSQSASDIRQTRLTAGFSRDLSSNVKLGLFYRYAFIGADDYDTSHTIDSSPVGLNSTHTAGHSSEFGLRLRGQATRRISYGFTAAWLGISLLDGMNRIAAVNSHERDGARRGSVAVGLGYALTRRTTLSFDLAGGSAHTGANRTEDRTGALLQDAVADSRFVSAHVAVQSDVTRHLFLTASFLNVWQAHSLNLNLFPDRYGNLSTVEDAFFPMSPTAAPYAPHFSDFGAGWRFTRNLFAQYLYSTDYGVSSGTHTVMLRYTFHGRD